jgi:hypothetical protein
MYLNIFKLALNHFILIFDLNKSTVSVNNAIIERTTGPHRCSKRNSSSHTQSSRYLGTALRWDPTWPPIPHLSTAPPSLWGPAGATLPATSSLTAPCGPNTRQSVKSIPSQSTRLRRSRVASVAPPSHATPRTKDPVPPPSQPCRRQTACDCTRWSRFLASTLCQICWRTLLTPDALTKSLLIQRHQKTFQTRSLVFRHSDSKGLSKCRKGRLPHPGLQSSSARHSGMARRCS